MFSKPWPIWEKNWAVRSEKKILFPRMLFLFLIFLLIPYIGINQISQFRNYSLFDPSLSIDTWMPFVPWMILIYFSLYLYYPLSAWYGIGDDRRVREMFVFHQGMFTVSACIYLIFLVAPVEVHLREQITQQELQGTGLLSTFYSMLHLGDAPYNAWPSLHVVQSFLILKVLERWNVWSHKIQILAWFAWFLMMISIMTTKQHFFFDLITGLLTAIYSWLYWIKPSMESCHDNLWSEKLQSSRDD